MAKKTVRVIVREKKENTVKSKNESATMEDVDSLNINLTSDSLLEDELFGGVDWDEEEEEEEPPSPRAVKARQMIEDTFNSIHAAFETLSIQELIEMKENIDKNKTVFTTDKKMNFFLRYLLQHYKIEYIWKLIDKASASYFNIANEIIEGSIKYALCKHSILLYSMFDFTSIQKDDVLWTVKECNGEYVSKSRKVVSVNKEGDNLCVKAQDGEKFEFYSRVDLGKTVFDSKSAARYQCCVLNKKYHQKN